MVYQEDVIRVAHHFAGLSLAEADSLRRGMSGKFRSSSEFKKVEASFFNNCSEKGIDTDREKDDEHPIKYYHPRLCLWEKKYYLCLRREGIRFIHHGAPFIKTMMEIQKKGLVLVQVDDYDSRLYHEGRGTRKITPWWREGFGGKYGI
jgi:hypothetical protein